MKNLKLKNSKYLTGLFKVISVSTVVLIAILSTIFYISAQHYIERALYNSFFDEFKRTESVLESLTEDMRTHLTYLQQTAQVQTLMNSEEISRSAERSALSVLSAYRNSNSIIHSIYVYNSRLDRYYIAGSQNRTHNNKDFYDSEITDIIKGGTITDFSQSVSRSIPEDEYSPDKKINVFTYILPENYSQSQYEKSYIVINVLTEDILKFLFNNSHDSQSQMFFYDSEKSAVISYEGQNSYKKIGDKISKKAEKSGYFIYRQSHGEKYLVMYQMLQSPEWALVNLTPYSTVSEQIDRFRITTLIILLTMLAVTLLFCFYTSKTVYKPISSVFEKIQKMTADYSRSSFSDISDSVDALRDEMAHLNSFRQKNSYIIKNETLKSFIFTDSESEIPVLNSVKDNTESVALVLFKIDGYNDYTEKYSYSDRMLYKYSFINIIEELVGEHFKCDFIDVSDEAITGIVKCDPKKDKSALKTAFLRIKQAIEVNFGITLSCFVSTKVNLPSNLSDIYENLYGISLYRFHYGKGCILFSDSFDEAAFAPSPLNTDDIKPLSNEIRLHHYEQSLSALKGIIKQIYSLNYTAAKISVYHLFIEIFSALTSIEKNFNHSLEINYTMMFDKITNQTETLYEIETELVTLLDCAFNAINVKKANKVHYIIESVCDYVANNYSNVNLCSTMIADSIKLSTRYLTKIFSENMSVSLPNYITNYRIEKSKELLLNTDLSVKEIVERIGWINLKYFYTIFKKTTGVTPGDFRSSGGKEK